MDLAVIKAKIAAGVLPSVNGIAVQQVRFVEGICIGCDARIPSDDVGGVAFEVDKEKRLLHPDCYVMWTEACAD